MNDPKILQKLRSRKTFSIDQLLSWLDCSLRTGRRRLKQWKAYTSINQNGRYYVLPDIPKFNQYGLWKHRNILFSQHGNLKQTMIHLIRESDRGLASHEIMDILGLPPSSSFLSHIWESPEIRREKHQGHYVYFSGESKIYTPQKRHWAVLEEEKQSQLPDEDAIHVLVYFIKHPHLSPEELASRISRPGHRIKAAGIRQLFESHGLLKKKRRV